jgi:Tfp pilus assembly protein PilN
MAEPDFLPSWYPQACQRKRLVVLQSWMVLVLVAGLAIWAFLVHRNIHIARGEVSALSRQLSQAGQDLRRLDELLALQKQWRQQDQIFEKLGTYVEATRFICAMDRIMPREMSLMNLTLETSEQAQPVSSLATAKTAQEQPVDRRLNIRLVGVAPTDVDLANFLARLTAEPLFEQVSMTYARERRDGGHVMREFELLFSVNLNSRPGA